MTEDRSIFLTKVYAKLSAYCAYQDRCTAEVEAKMKEFELSTEETILMEKRLTEERFLDDDRYAESIVRGKFFHKKWGKQKIRFLLKQKGISEAVIQKKLQLISPEEYWDAVRHLTEKKLRELGIIEKPDFHQKQKVSRFLAQKGFEFSVISEVLSE